MFNFKRVAPLTGEQGIPDNDESTGFFSAQRVVLLVGVPLFIGLIGYSYYFNADDEQKENVQAVAVAARSALPDISFPVAKPAESRKQEAVAPPAEKNPAIGAAEPAQPEVIVKWLKPPVPAIPRIDHGRSTGVSVGQAVQSSVQQVNGTTADAQSGTQQTTGQSATANAQGGTQQTTGQSALNVAGVESVEAVKLTDLDTTILAGELIPCTLNGDMNSQIGGAFTCTVIQDVKSADASHVLIGAGSQASGYYASDTSSSAVTRTAAIFGRLVTPDDNAINLDSTASDSRGATGIPADRINRHVLTRFGSAFAVALISNAINGVGGTGDTTGDVIVNSATGSTTNDLATEVFKETAGIPSTRETDRGSVITIYIRKDLKFGAVL